MPQVSKTPGVVSLRKLDSKADPFGFQLLKEVPVVGINWIWKPYIPRAALSLIMGDGGYGKSWLTCALAADLSKGRPLPGQDALPPQKVLMIGAEDGLSQVIKPKMIMLDADMDNIMASDRGFTIDPDALVHLIRHIKDYDAAIVFLDPLVVYMGGKIDMHKANEARSVLTMLSNVAKETNTAIVAVHHVRKSGEGSLQHKVMGSADFMNGVRSGLLVDVSKAGQRYMAHVKSNWAANGPTLAYNFGTNGFQWQGEYSGQIDNSPEVSRTPRGAVQEWLKATLREGPVPALEMLRLANEEGFSEKTLERAKKGIVTSLNVGGMWVWSLEKRLMEQIQLQEAARQVQDMGAGSLMSQMARLSTLEPQIVAPSPPITDALAHAQAVLAAKQGRLS